MEEDLEMVEFNPFTLVIVTVTSFVIINLWKFFQEL